MGTKNLSNDEKNSDQIGFYERRKTNIKIGFNDRRIGDRRNSQNPVLVEQRRRASQVRRYERESFKIPVRLETEKGEVTTYTDNISPEGLLIVSETDMIPGTPLSLQFSFGENVCYLNISGQIVFSRLEQSKRAIGVKFSAIRDFEQIILTSAAREIMRDSTVQKKSLLHIYITKDALVQESTRFDEASSEKTSNYFSKVTKLAFPVISSRNTKDIGGVSFELTQEQVALRETVRKFVQKEIIPVSAYYDRTGEFPWNILRNAYGLGIFNSYIPEEYGGGGLGIFETALITEELGAGCMAMGTSIMVNLLGVSPLLIAGTKEQKEKYLIPYCRELTLFSFCFTEPDAGSDPSRISTRAELKDDYYILNGSKCFITNGGIANYYVVFATMDRNLGTKGLTAFLTPSNAGGIRIGKALDKMGQRASNTAEIYFDGVRVPRENRIGAEGEGYKIALQSISKSRINVAAGAVGIARTAMEHALKYVQKRIQFDQPLANFQYVKFRLADMTRDIDAARLLAWRAACVHDSGKRYANESSMAKDFAGDVAMRVTSEALDLLGGYGYSKEYPMEKLMRDAKLMQIYEGPSPIHKIIISRELFQQYGF